MKTHIRPLNNSRQSGFTLIELMMVIVILAIALAIGAPSFQEMTRRANMSETTNTLIGTLRYARAQAVRTGQTWVVGASTDFDTPDNKTFLSVFGKTVTAAPDYYLAAWSNSDYTSNFGFDASTDGDDVIKAGTNIAQKVQSLVNTGTYLTSSVNNLKFIAFLPDGTARDNANVLWSGGTVGKPIVLGICDDRANETGRALTLLPSGVIAIQDKNDC